MTGRKFAPWVKPLAEKMARMRIEILDVAAKFSPEMWNLESQFDNGWTYKDQIAHVGDAHRNLQEVMEAIIEGRDPHFERFLRIDEINEENRQNHLDDPPEGVIAHTRAAAEDTQNVLARLTPDHAESRVGPMTLGQALQGFAMHDEGHLEELRKALR